MKPVASSTILTAPSIVGKWLSVQQLCVTYVVIHHQTSEAGKTAILTPGLWQGPLQLLTVHYGQIVKLRKAEGGTPSFWQGYRWPGQASQDLESCQQHPTHQAMWYSAESKWLAL